MRTRIICAVFILNILHECVKVKKNEDNLLMRGFFKTRYYKSGGEKWEKT